MACCEPSPELLVLAPPVKPPLIEVPDLGGEFLGLNASMEEALQKALASQFKRQESLLRELLKQVQDLTAATSKLQSLAAWEPPVPQANGHANGNSTWRSMGDATSSEIRHDNMSESSEYPSQPGFHNVPTWLQDVTETIHSIDQKLFQLCDRSSKKTHKYGAVLHSHNKVPRPSNALSTGTEASFRVGSAAYSSGTSSPEPWSPRTNATKVSFKSKAQHTLGKLANSASLGLSMDNIRLALKSKKHRGQCATILWRFFENPHSSPLAHLYARCTTLLVIFAVVLSAWQTVEECPLKDFSGEALQIAIEVIFTWELVMRFLVCPDRLHFLRGTFNCIDLLAALPIIFRLLVISRAIRSDHGRPEEMLAGIGIVPFLRILKLARRFEKLQLLLSAFMMAFEALPVLLFTLVVFALLFAGLIHLAEPSYNITSFPHALWFILVTLTTVGYGDVTPESTLGHFISAGLMVVSQLYMAIPIGIVGNAFSTVWGQRDRLLLMQRVRRAFLQEGFNADALQEAISMFDVNGDGELDLHDFQNMLTAMNIELDEDRVFLLMEGLDDDGSGTINVDELMNGLFPRDYRELFKQYSCVLEPRSTKSLRTTSSKIFSENSESKV